LEALLKRVDGLEKRLQDAKKSKSPNGEADSGEGEEIIEGDPKPKRPQLNTNNVSNETAVFSPTPIR
jgi:hypothetical protein